jgi:hypothetical protein
VTWNWAIIVPAILGVLTLTLAALNYSITRASFQRGGWKVKAHLERLNSPTDDVLLLLRLNNASVALEAKIVAFVFAFDYVGIKFRGSEANKSIVEGPELTYSLPSGEEATWKFSLTQMRSLIQHETRLTDYSLGLNPKKLLFGVFAGSPFSVGINIRLGSGDEFKSRLGILSSSRVAVFLFRKNREPQGPRDS